MGFSIVEDLRNSVACMAHIEISGVGLGEETR